MELKLSHAPSLQVSTQCTSYGSHLGEEIFGKIPECCSLTFDTMPQPVSNSFTNIDGSEYRQWKAIFLCLF